MALIAGCNFSINAEGGTSTSDAAVDSALLDEMLVDAAPTRVSANLVALYTFEEGSGTSVLDRSNVGTPLDLTIPTPSAVIWSPGALTVTADTLIASPGAATKVLDACRDADALTLEAWITPAMIGGYFPRVVTLSETNSSLAVSLLAIDSHLEFRMRGPMTDSNGLPSLSSPAGSVVIAPLHVTLVSASDGARTIYVNGVSIATDALGGDLASWGTTGHRFGLANEIDGGRPWLGTFDLVAIYAAALTPAEVAINFAAGPR